MAKIPETWQKILETSAKNTGNIVDSSHKQQYFVLKYEISYYKQQYFMLKQQNFISCFLLVYRVCLIFPIGRIQQIIINNNKQEPPMGQQFTLLPFIFATYCQTITNILSATKDS
jgi:hypothetical protein